jgi:hypothetical protein
MTLEGNFKGLYRIPAPAYIHCDCTLLDLQANDMLFCRYLRAAAETKDPLERIKNIIVFLIACQYINPTIV